MRLIFLIVNYNKNTDIFVLTYEERNHNRYVSHGCNPTNLNCCIQKQKAFLII